MLFDERATTVRLRLTAVTQAEAPMISFHILGTLSLQGDDGGELSSFLTGSKRVALLTYLALATPRGFHRRDTLLALFWPELDQKHARASLRNMLYQVRRSLGKGVIGGRGDDEIGLIEGSFWCDALAFEEALDAGRTTDALRLYRGAVLDGFFIPDASPEFEQWLDGYRTRLSRRAANAAWLLVDQADHAGEAGEAIRWARRAVAFDRYDEGGARRLISLLDGAGDRAGALRAYEDFAERLATEFDAPVSAETRALIATIRTRREVRQAPSPPLEPAGAPDSTEAGIPTAGVAQPGFDAAPAASEGIANGTAEPPSFVPSSAISRPRWLRRATIGAVLGTLAAAVIAAVGVYSSQPPATPTIAVGEIQNYASGDTMQFGMLGTMLATNLARVPELRVLSTGRLYELAAPSGRGPGAMQMAARRAGANEIVEGTLYSHAAGRLRLDLRRIDLATGVVRESYRVEGESPFVLVDRATALLLADFNLPAPSLGIASVTTSSLVAFRFYEEGLSAYYEGDNRGAERFFSAALAEDPDFAMAAYYRALSHEDVDHAAFRQDLGRAVRFADQASDRERLLIRTAWAREMDEPRQLALAESLVVRYPAEPDGHLFFGEARLWSGDFLGALSHLRHVVAMDSTSVRGPDPRCRACDARRGLATAYMLADSLAAAEREARRWVQLQRGSARAWRILASTLEYQGRADEARVARSMAGSLGSNNPRDPIYPAVLALREGDFITADRVLAGLGSAADPLVRQNVLWYRVLSLRYQGRFDEALHTAREYRQMVLAATTTGHPALWAPVLEAQVRFEIGQPREAAALWQEIAEHPYEPDSPSRTARHRAWTLTHTAAALAAAGDTVRLAALADTIEALGAQSGYGRDPRLHHYVRGLVFSARGDTAAAANAYRQAMFSTTAGYGRINLELGRALVVLGRPREAVEVVGAALRGPLDAGNLYVNRTELHALLARAYRATGQSDSALVHARWVARARAGADGELALDAPFNRTGRSLKNPF